GDLEKERKLLHEAVAASARAHAPGHRFRIETQRRLEKALTRQAEMAIKNKDFKTASQRIEELKSFIESVAQYKVDPKVIENLKAHLPVPPT
ncbi:MAG: hypothetical protein AAGC68_17230, partial [Verrucomicrobiota bacterium]